MATIQLRRHLVGGPVAPPATLNPGELFFNLPGFTGNGPNSLWIDTGAALIPLVDNTRQMEVAAAQAITGVKTFSTNTLRITGGAADNVLLTDGIGNVRFGPPPSSGIASVTSDATLTGDGSPASPLSVAIATPTARGAINVPQGALFLTGSALSLSTAGPPAITAGVDTLLPIASNGLRLVMGADVAALQTTVKTVVPAINELVGAIGGLTGNLQLGGTYDVAANQVTPSPNPINPIPPGQLPLPTAARSGWYLICTTAGAGSGNAPAPPGGSYTRGDWIICDQTPAWVPVALGGAVLTAANVGITTIPPLAASNVQDALAQIYAVSLQAVATDGSLFGLGTVASPLSVDIVDGGLY
jgi:hypothetical protein